MGRENILMGFEIFILDKLCSTTRSPPVSAFLCTAFHSLLLIFPAHVPGLPASLHCALSSYHFIFLIFCLPWKF